MKKIILSLCLFSTLVQAEALTKGTPAPFTGILLTEEEARNADKALIDLDASKQSTDLYKKNFDIANTQADYWKQNALEANKELVSRDNRRFWENSGYFAFGSAITILLAFAVSKSTK